MGLKKQEAGAKAPDSSIWDRYWQFDRIASCFDQGGTNFYDDSIAAGWRAFFEKLNPAARVLDLCTGNGAIAVIAAEVSRRKNKAFAISAVDRANIDPRAHVSRHREELSAITFLPRTAVEDLPFADRSFDAVVSQYGIEYTDLPRTVAEIGRVLSAGGLARIVLHAAEGVVCEDAMHVIGDADFLLDEIDLPGAASRCMVAVTAAERDPNADEEAHRRARSALAAFETALTKTGRRMAEAADKGMLRNSGAVLLDTFKRHGRFDVDQLLAKVAEVRTGILDHRGRLQALVQAAVTRSELEDVASALKEAGADQVEETDLRKGSALVGYIIETRFPDEAC